MSKVSYGLILVSILFLLSFTNVFENNKEPYNNITIDCVIARYNESLDWLMVSEFQHITRFIIYNKGKPITTILPLNATVINIPNVGKCDHTYLYHIVRNYDNLADMTIFISGTLRDHRKGPRLKNTIKLVNKTKNSVFIVDKLNVPHDIYNFSMSYYMSSNPINQVDEGSIAKLYPANIRPFGKWFEYHWPNQSTVGAPYTSIFAVHKKHILQHEKKYYISFLEEVSVDVNPEVGHYLERSWLMIFSPIPPECIYDSNYVWFSILRQ